MPVSRPLRTGDEQRLEIAIKDKRIASAPLTEIKEVLRLVMLKLGIRGSNMPGELEKAVLIGHICENFSGHTLSEIKLAFDMAIAGKLDVEANCYENFSCAYFSTILNAYRRWAAEAYKTLPAPEILENKPDKTTIEIEYAYFRQKEINKLPCRI